MEEVVHFQVGIFMFTHHARSSISFDCLISLGIDYLEEFHLKLQYFLISFVEF